MRTRLGAPTTFCVLFLGSACGRPPGDALPGGVREEVEALARQCSEVGGTPHTDRAVRRADLDGDGDGDFVVFAGWIDCQDAVSVYGDREKHLVVLVADASGEVRSSFSDAVYAATIEDDSIPATLWLTVSGVDGGRPRAPDFASESFCERALSWDADKQAFDYADLDSVRMIE